MSLNLVKVKKGLVVVVGALGLAIAIKDFLDKD